MATRSALGTQAASKRRTYENDNTVPAPSGGISSTSSAQDTMRYLGIPTDSDRVAHGNVQGYVADPLSQYDYLNGTGFGPNTGNKQTWNTSNNGSVGSGGSGGGSPGGNGSSPASTGSAVPHSDIPFDSGYVPTNDPAYMDALNALNNLTGNAPTYTPSYDDQLAELYNRIIGRGPFQYDLNQDPFYQQYRTQAIDTGRIAMADSMGQAAALTGGYGSSYGAQVGQQTYDAYLRQLNEQVPEFYNSAYNRWLNEGNQLEEQYNLTRGMANDEYNRYQDSLSDYYRQLNIASDRENQLYNRGYQQNVDANQARESNRDRLLQLITSTGYQPSNAELEAAGMSPSEAAAWNQYYVASLTPRGGGGGGSGSDSGSSGGNLKLDFKTDEINAARDAWVSGGSAALTRALDDLALQGYSDDELEALGNTISRNYAANGGKGDNVWATDQNDLRYLEMTRNRK